MIPENNMYTSRKGKIPYVPFLGVRSNLAGTTNNLVLVLAELDGAQPNSSSWDLMSTPAAVLLLQR